MIKRARTKLDPMGEPQHSIGWTQLSEVRMPLVEDLSIDRIDLSDPNEPRHYGIGTEEHDFICGAENCDEILIKGWTKVSLQANFRHFKPRCGLCRCGQWSALPDAIG